MVAGGVRDPFTAGSALNLFLLFSPLLALLARRRKRESALTHESDSGRMRTGPPERSP